MGWREVECLGRLAPMLQEDKQILWRTSAVLIGAALPSMLLGKGIMFTLLLLGMFSGLMATKDESLRVTLRMLLDSRITMLALLLLASLLVGVATGINPLFALNAWEQVAFVGFAGAAMFVTLREMPGRHIELLMKVLVIGTFIAAGLAIADALIHDPRLSAALHGPDMALMPQRLNYMSSVLAVILPFGWARLMIKSREGEPFAGRIALPAASLGLVVALVCGDIAGWVGLGVAVLLFFWLAGHYHSFVVHKRHWLMAIGLLLLSAVLYGFAFGWTTVAGRTADMLGKLGGIWHVGLVHILDKPVFGIGVMNYRNLPGAADLHPHSWLLQMLLEGGIVSTAIFITMMVLVMRRFSVFAKGSLYGVAAVASLSAFLVSGMANTSIFNGWWMTFMLVSCLFGWRAGWGGSDLKKRRRAPNVVKSTTGF